MSESSTAREVIADALHEEWESTDETDDWALIAAETAISALSEAGLVVVPKEPTEQMVDAAFVAWTETTGGGLAHDDSSWVASWRAVLGVVSSPTREEGTSKSRSAVGRIGLSGNLVVRTREEGTS